MAFGTDTFTNTAGTAVSTHNALWVQHPLRATGALVITDANRARGNANAHHLFYYDTDPGADDYPVTVRVRVASVLNPAGAAARQSTSSNGALGFAAYHTRLEATGVFLYRINGDGGQITLASVLFTPTVGEDYDLTVYPQGVGATVTVDGKVKRVSDSQYLTSGATWQAGEVNFASIADSSASRIVARNRAAIYEFGISTNSTGFHIDSFSAGLDTVLAVGVGSITDQTDTTMSYSFVAATGGTDPKTYAIYRLTDPSANANTGTLIDTTLTGTATGLTPETFYCFKCIVTDAVAATEETADAAVTAIGFTLPADKDIDPTFHQIGDSITTGGTPTTVAKLATVLATLLDVGSITSGINGVGGGGMGSFVNEDLSAHANLTGAIAAADTAGVTDFNIALGINDPENFTKAQWKARYVALIGHIRTGAWPELARIWLLPNTGRLVGGGNGGNQVNHDRYREYQEAIREIVAEDDGADGITLYAGSLARYEYVLSHPERLTDGTHLDQTGLDQIGTLDAHHWYMTMLHEAYLRPADVAAAVAAYGE